MGMITGMIHSVAKFLSSHEPVKPEKLGASNTMMGQAENRYSHSKGRNVNERVMGPGLGQSQTSQGKYHQVLRLKNNPLWSDALPFRLIGAAVSPSGLTEVGTASSTPGSLQMWRVGIACSGGSARSPCLACVN